MSIERLFGAIALSLFVSSAQAQTELNQTVESYRQQGSSVKSISPIYSQLLLLSFPSGFKTVFENVRGPQYIREAVLDGEDVNQWTQMLTITGAKGLAAKADLTPKKFAEGMAAGYQRACPNSFSVKSFADEKISGYESFTAIMSCGASPSTGGRTSESAVVLVIKGEADYYTIQWAQRAQASTTPIPIDAALWAQRLKRLAPVKLCPIVAGEAAPYPSCIDSK
jgi:hypothetical protein